MPILDTPPKLEIASGGYTEDLAVGNYGAMTAACVVVAFDGVSH